MWETKRSEKVAGGFEFLTHCRIHSEIVNFNYVDGSLR